MPDGSNLRSVIKICRTLSAVIPSPSPPPGLGFVVFVGGGVLVCAQSVKAGRSIIATARKESNAVRLVFMAVFLNEVLTNNNEKLADNNEKLANFNEVFPNNYVKVGNNSVKAGGFNTIIGKFLL